jgi:hypothetical protein
MYEEDPAFQQPDNLDARVWRYMDFFKFVSLLQKSALYFARADKLDDPFEGSYPKINVSARMSFLAETLGFPSPEARTNAIKEGEFFNKQWRRYIAINCWHLNDHESVESAAMWQLYTKSNNGIAVQSTYRHLRDAFEVTTEKVFLGIVKYVDYEHGVISPGIFTPFVHKRKSFQHENEVRAAILKWPEAHPARSGLDFNLETISHGVAVDINIHVLVRNIYVAPGTPEWIVDTVRSVVEHYGYNFPVMPSDLDQQPVY